MTLGADLSRWALFAVWDGAGDLERFLETSAASRRWERTAVERWDAGLRLIAARGAWGGTGLRPAGPPPAAPHAGPVAVLTRASIHATRLRAFYSAVAPVQPALLAAPGRLRSVGVGEWPLARQATFSLWRSHEQARAFAYGAAPHAAVVRRTRAEGWYAEELFAHFSVATIAGTWGGADPLS